MHASEKQTATEAEAQLADDAKQYGIPMICDGGGRLVAIRDDGTGRKIPHYKMPRQSAPASNKRELRSPQTETGIESAPAPEQSITSRASELVAEATRRGRTISDEEGVNQVLAEHGRPLLPIPTEAEKLAQQAHERSNAWVARQQSTAGEKVKSDAELREEMQKVVERARELVASAEQSGKHLLIETAVRQARKEMGLCDD